VDPLRRRAGRRPPQVREAPAVPRDKLADFLVAEGVVDDISIEGLREILRAKGVSFQRIKTWKQFPGS
jgi:hypothetical protein